MHSLIYLGRLNPRTLGPHLVIAESNGAMQSSSASVFFLIIIMVIFKMFFV
jgi:hypothetical protein